MLYRVYLNNRLVKNIFYVIEEQQVSSTNELNRKQRQLLGTNLLNPYYAFNPDYMGGNMPNVQLYQNNINNGQPSTCTCTCGDVSFRPSASCITAQTCVAYCLQMYPGRCTVVNTYGCCGSSCQFFQAQSLDTRYCTCNCAGQQFLNPIDTCVSTQACLTRCLTNFPQACTPTATQACCGQDCQSYSQAVADACACRCQGNTYYPSPKCASPEGCVSTCMTVSEHLIEPHCISKFLHRLTGIVSEIKLKVAVEHRVPPMYQHAHAIVDQILQLLHPSLVKAVELV